MDTFRHELTIGCTDDTGRLVYVACPRMCCGRSARPSDQVTGHYFGAGPDGVTNHVTITTAPTAHTQLDLFS